MNLSEITPLCRSRPAPTNYGQPLWSRRFRVLDTGTDMTILYAGLWDVPFKRFMACGRTPVSLCAYEFETIRSDIYFGHSARAYERANSYNFGSGTELAFFCYMAERSRDEVLAHEEVVDVGPLRRHIIGVLSESVVPATPSAAPGSEDNDADDSDRDSTSDDDFWLETIQVGPA